MNFSKKSVLTCSIGALVIALTVIVFFSISYQKEYIRTLGFYVALIVEMISVLAFLIFNKVATGDSRAMMSAGAYTMIFLYLTASLVFLIFSLVFLKNAPIILVVGEIIFLAILVTVSIIIFTF